MTQNTNRENNINREDKVYHIGKFLPSTFRSSPLQHDSSEIPFVSLFGFAT